MRINESTLAKLKELTGDRIATLEEVLHFIDGNVEKILVELKESGYEEKVLEVIKKEELLDKVIIVSFHEEALARVRNLDGEIETGLVYAKIKKPIETAIKLNAQYLIPLYRFVHRRDVAKAHKSNLKVIVWTINTKEEAGLYMAKDVDGIATDKPAIFKGMTLTRIQYLKTGIYAEKPLPIAICSLRDPCTINENVRVYWYADVLQRWRM